jgi:ubiquinone/menaquinone biosynthesis C-methylase UbiE
MVVVIPSSLCHGAAVSEMWNGVAGGWEKQADFVDRHTAAATEAMLDAAAIGPGDEVLDLACGPGGAGIAAAHRVGESGRVMLADIASAMVEIAARRSAALPQVGTMVCDELAVDAADSSFDAVICRHGLMFVADPAAAVRESARVLRPGGRYATVTWADRAANPWLGLLLDAVGEQFGTIFPPPGVLGPFSLDAPEVLGEALRAGGLDEVQVSRLDMPMPAPSLEAWWERVQQLAGPLALMLAGLEPSVRDAIHERALSYGEKAARSTDDGVLFDGSVLLASGVRR